MEIWKSYNESYSASSLGRFKNIKTETIAKHTTEYFAKVEIDDDVLVFLKPLKKGITAIQLSGIEYE
jgi:alpha-acetolactate decarboxylase